MDGEEKEELLISDLPDNLNPYKDYKTVSEKQLGELSVKITTDGLKIPVEQADRLIDNAHKAFVVANKINGGPIRGYEDELTIRFPKEGLGGLMVNLNAHRELLNEDDQSQTAAVVHEMIHGIQGNAPGPASSLPQETVPLTAEFLFSGESRDPFFLYLTEEVIDQPEDDEGLSSHASGWKRSIKILSEAANTDVNLTNESAEVIMSKIEKARSVEESAKIALIKRFIDQSNNRS